MKRLLYAMCLITGLGGVSHAIQSVSESIYTASTTVTNDTTKNLPGARPGSELFAIVVSSASTNGVLGLYDSSGTATILISSVSLTTVQNPQFFIRVSSGITYTTTGNANGVTILYRNPNLL